MLVLLGVKGKYEKSLFPFTEKITYAFDLHGNEERSAPWVRVATRVAREVLAFQ